MEKDEFIDDLGIDGKAQFDENGNYVVTLDESSWVATQSILDNPEKNLGLEEDEESSTISYEASNLQYLNDYFIINLIADFQANEYKLIIKNR